jgi:hypothetical protein
MLIEHHPRHLK